MKKVIVGMSGGVDSSVAAWILKKQGYQVEGLFMKNWENNHHSLCESSSDLSDAYSVCDALDINFHTINFSKEYWQEVFKTFLKEYKIGRTPNPDVLCNKNIKFKYFLKFATNILGADLIATGHYVQCINTNYTSFLIRGIDSKKDQSYFLHTLRHQQLKKCLFPLGKLTKLKVRKIAKQLNLSIACKKDSTGICFIGKYKFIDFLSNYIPKNPGIIINTNGEKIGVHQGVSFYTLGQRKGLNIGGMHTGNGKPWYVVDKDVTRNILYVAQGNHHPCLMSSKFTINKTNWISFPTINNKKFYCSVKTRYCQPDTQCYICSNIENDTYCIILKKPIFAITPGQSAVFYLNNYCLGGGIIFQRDPVQSINI